MIESWVDQLGWDDTDPARWCNYGTVHFVNVQETMCDGTLRLSGGVGWSVMGHRYRVKRRGGVRDVMSKGRYRGNGGWRVGIA